MVEVEAAYLRDGGRKAAASRNPEHSEYLRKLWQDPAMREKWIKSRARAARKRKRDGNPIHNNRWQIPAGFRADTVKVFRKQARLEATLTMKKLEKASVLDDLNQEAHDALHTCLTIMRMGEACSLKDKLAAAAKVLEYTMAKPTQKQDVTVRSAEEWLEKVTEDNEQAADEGDAADPEASA